MAKAEIIRALLNQGHAPELRDLLFGSSPYTDKAARAPKADPPPLTHIKLVAAARNHLVFVCKFGTQKDHVIEGHMHHFSHKEKFEHWLAEDAPGVTESELKRLLKATS
ncbi:hypothetical protein [Rhodanobacter sp. C01]|uniref:hypothetical protein n=1 Tax=Rhodanobacter sp. C01 TaxID=1945856 RepID=UPI0011158E5B|nr:hypothetical protein [Rhodanobacter sp. C01]